MSLIGEMEKNSGVRFDEANVALARQWMGPDTKDISYKVKIKSVDPSKQGSFHLDSMGQAPPSKGKEKVDDSIRKVAVPKTVEEAAEIIKKFERGAPRGDDGVADSIAQHVQMDDTPLESERWAGTQEEEKAWYVVFSWLHDLDLSLISMLVLFSFVSELVYIHSKVSIAWTSPE